MVHRPIQWLLLTIGAAGICVMPAFAASITARYPWIVKSQSDLTKAECTAASRHDYNYWWAGNKCHMKFIRDAWGVVIRDSADTFSGSIIKKGELIEGITQYRPDEGTYCVHGGSCSPAKDVKLLGSILTATDDGGVKTGDASDFYKSVSTSCELILADRANIIKAKAQKMLKDCH